MNMISSLSSSFSISMLGGLIAAGSTLYAFTPSFFTPPLKNPERNLTGTVIQSKLSLENFSDHLLITNIQSMLIEKSPFLQFNKDKVDLFCHHRNFLSEVLALDDRLRLEGSSLQKELNPEQKTTLLQMTVEIENYIKQQKEIKSPQEFGELIRVIAALKHRLGLDEKELSPQESIDLLPILYNFRKNEILHLMLPSQKQLFTRSVDELKALKKADQKERLENLELVAPINMGLSDQELNEFVEQLLEPAQKQLFPLLNQRKELIAQDDIWEALIDKKLEEQSQLKNALNASLAKAQEDVKELISTPCFARALLQYSQYFSEDLFDACFIMKLVSLKNYFESPHALIMLSEYHLNKQIFAAKDCLQPLSEECPVLMISSSLDENHPHIPVSEIPFSQVHVSDDFQRAIGKEHLRRLNASVGSSCRPEETKIFYLPGRGICQHNPNYIPEKMEDFTAFDSIDKENSFTPAISFGEPNSCLAGTHAFTELYFDNKRYVPGKYVRFDYDYDNLSTYPKIASSIFPRILNPNQGAIFSPDPAVAYENHTRHIAKLNTPLPMNSDQKEAVYNILRNTYLGDKDYPFTAHNCNCTTLTESLLKIAGVDLPCRAPFSSLLRIGFPSYTPVINWLSDHQNLTTPILRSISSVSGAQKGEELSLEKSSYVITPFIPRLWVSLKNSIEEIEGAMNS